MPVFKAWEDMSGIFDSATGQVGVTGDAPDFWPGGTQFESFFILRLSAQMTG